MENFDECLSIKAQGCLIDGNQGRFEEILSEFKFTSECVIGGLSLLHSAAIFGNTRATYAIIAKFPELIDIEDNNLNTPLHWAARYGYSDICNILITSGADALVNNKNNESPFYIALKNYRKCFKYNGDRSCVTNIGLDDFSDRKDTMLCFVKDPNVVDMIIGLLRS